MLRRLLLIFVLSLVALPVGAQSDALVPTTFFLTFIPNVQFSPVYVAEEKGYFETAGYDVTIEHADEPIGLDLIAAGQREFGIISAEQVIAGRANGRPVVSVYEWFQQYPVGIMVTNESGFASVEDLRGQRVGIPGRFGASYSGLIALLAANGMTEQDIQLEEIGYNAPEVICVGAIQASVVYLNNEPLQVEQRAANGECGDVTGVQVFAVGDAIDLVSNGLVTNETMIAEQPERVRSMVWAYDAGLRDAIQNPAEAYLITTNFVENLPMSDDFRAALETAAAETQTFLDENPDADRETIAERRDALDAQLSEQFTPDELIQFHVLLATIELWDADVLGYSEPESWEAMQAALLSINFIPEAIDVTAAYTNDFLPEGD
jgi:NitT/TauT family transport system substrate-binding protein